MNNIFIKIYAIVICILFLCLPIYGIGVGAYVSSSYFINPQKFFSSGGIVIDTNCSNDNYKKY